MNNTMRGIAPETAYLASLLATAVNIVAGCGDATPEHACAVRQGVDAWKRKRSSAVFPLWLLSALVLLAPAPLVKAQSKVVAAFSVHAGKYQRVNVPVTASLKGVPLRLHDGALQLFEITGGEDLPVASQLDPGMSSRMTWILDGETPPGAVRNFELRVVEERQMPDGAGPVQVEDDGESLQVRIGDKPILAYRYTFQGVPEGVDEIYNRSGFIHPIWSPEGEILSRIQPPDHYHHYGLWNPWTRTEFEGRSVDFWNLADGQGTVRARQVMERTAGPLFGGFKALLDHVDFTGGEAKVALNEQWEVKVWNVDPDRKVWLIDFVSTRRSCCSRGVHILMSRKGRWPCNVYVERLWRSLKQEEVYRRAYEAVAGAEKRIADYLRCFNEPHTRALTADRPTTYSTNENWLSKRHNPTQQYT